MDLSDYRLPRTRDLRLVVPHEVRARRSYLEWRFAPETDPVRLPDWKWVEPPPGLLARFTRLADASGEQIVAFAERYGVLGACEHGEPAPHAHCPPVFAPDEFGRPPARGSEHQPGTWFGESPAIWGHWARRLGAAAEIADLVRQERLPNDVLWKRLDYGDPPVKIVWRGNAPFQGVRSLDEARVILEEYLAEFALSAGFRPKFNANSGSVHVAPAHGTYMGRRKAHWIWAEGALFPALVVALLNQHLGSECTAVCSECDEPYDLATGQRRPRSDRRNFCSDDCRDEARRERDRRRRRTLKRMA